jgi:ATP-binding cassette, subfamily B, bacterial
MSILEFKNVSFQYDVGQKMILKDVSFSMDAGKTYAFVGPTGEGKSTTASLISRLYEPTAGEIVFQNKNLNDWSSEDLYWEIGFILQEPYLYTGSVLDNIVYGNRDFIKYSRIFENDETKNLEYAEFEEVLKQKDLSRLLHIFPEGLKTQVTNNSENISLGQKQIINFMRVILRNPSFLILDEATANLDTVTEQSLQEILDGLPESTTKMIIAHRLNTIKTADQVFMVGGGKVKSQVRDLN